MVGQVAVGDLVVRARRSHCRQLIAPGLTQSGRSIGVGEVSDRLAPGPGAVAASEADTSGSSGEEHGDVLEELAGELGRSVVINDPLVRVLYTSRHHGDEDSLRVRAVLQHDAGPAARRFISSTRA